MPLGYPLDPRIREWRRAQWDAFDDNAPTTLEAFLPRPVLEEEADQFVDDLNGSVVDLIDREDIDIVDATVIRMKHDKHSFAEIGAALGMSKQGAAWRWNRILRDYGGDTLTKMLEVKMMSERDLDAMWDALKDVVTTPGIKPREQDVMAALKIIQVRRENAGLAGAGTKVDINLNGLGGMATGDERDDPENAPGMVTVHAIEELTGLAEKVAGNMRRAPSDDDDELDDDDFVMPLKTPVLAPGSSEPIHARVVEDDDLHSDRADTGSVLSTPGRWIGGKFVPDDAA